MMKSSSDARRRCWHSAWSLGWLGALVVATPASAVAADTLMPTIVHEACLEYAQGKPFVVRARFEDESQLYDPQLVYRLRPGSRWQQVLFSKEPDSEDFAATIYPREPAGPIEYYIQVFDEHGNGPARIGGTDAPIEVLPAPVPVPCQQIPLERAVTVTESSARPQAPSATDAHGPSGRQAAVMAPAPPPVPGTCDGEDRPLYCEPWLWAAAGGVVLTGAGVAVYFLAFRGDDAAASTITLSISGPDPSVNSTLGHGR